MQHDTRLASSLRRFAEDTSGTTVMEYALLASLASVVGIIALLALLKI